MAIGERPGVGRAHDRASTPSSEFVRAAADDEAPEDFVDGLEREYARSALEARTPVPAWSADELDEPDMDIVL
jgi:hypothetical protein